MRPKTDTYLHAWYAAVADVADLIAGNPPAPIEVPPVLRVVERKAS